MEAPLEKMGQPELDLIDQLDEVLSASNSMLSALQMALDLICIGLNRASGGLIVPPSLRQENARKVWYQPDPQWVLADGALAEPVARLAAETLRSERQQVLDKKTSGMVGIPVMNRKKPIGILLLSGGAVSDAEENLLENLLRLLAKRIRSYQTDAATIGRDQFAAILRTASSAQSSLDFETLKTRIAATLVNATQAQGIILILPAETSQQKWTRTVFIKKDGWHVENSIEFSHGLLRECIDRGELLQWRKPVEQAAINTVIDLVDGIQNRSLVGVPLLAGGQRMGTLGILDSNYFPFDEITKSLVTSLAGTLAAAFYTRHLVGQVKSANAEIAAKRFEVTNSRSALRVLFESIPFSFYIINQEFRIVAVNSARAQMAGSTIPALVGKVCYEGLYHSKKICQGCLVSTTLQTGTNSTREKRTWLKNDTASDWVINCYPINDNAGKTVQAILVEQEVTEKRRLEAELIQSDKLVATGQLAAGVAHEINNPLAAIIANAQILLQDIPPENQDLIESVKLIELAGLRASHVVKNLLGLARKEEYDFTRVDLNESIQDALSLLSHEFVARPIAIRYERGLNLPPIIASREHLESIWINLLMNSIEAISDEAGSIEINTLYDEGDFYILIKDSGVGIPEEQLGRIFEPFYTTKSHNRGTGLGLSMVKRIVKAHSGSIQVDSEIGKGTTFTVILPEKPAAYQGDDETGM